MPETDSNFSVSILNIVSGEPFIEYGSSNHFDAKTDTHFYTCFIMAYPSIRFSVSIKSRNPRQCRMGVILLIDDVEQNRVGLRPGYGVNLAGRPIAANMEQPFEFSPIQLPSGNVTVGAGNIKIEFWRSVVTDVTDGVVTYAPIKTDEGPLIATRLAQAKPSESITKVSKVQYLDKHPRMVFVFEYRNREALTTQGYGFTSILDMKNGSVPFTGELLQDSTKKLPVIETPNSNIPPPIANFASGAARPLYHPSSFPSPTTSVDVVRKILIEVVDKPENALALVQALRKRHGQEIFELQIKRKNDSTEEQISKVVKVMNDDEN